MFKIYNYAITKTISEIDNEEEARIFAKHYSRGSYDILTQDVWIFKVNGMEGESAIACYMSGVRFDRVN